MAFIHIHYIVYENINPIILNVYLNNEQNHLIKYKYDKQKL